MDIVKSHGLALIAGVLCGDQLLETMEDLGRLSDAAIDGLNYVPPQQGRRLKCLCEACRRGDPGLLEDVWTERGYPAAKAWNMCWR